MNQSAQDHQTLFTCDSDSTRPADESKSINVIVDVHQTVLCPVYLEVQCKSVACQWSAMPEVRF